MLEVISVPTLLSRPRLMGAAWHFTGSWWTRPEEVALKALCEYGAPLEKSADALGRTPSSIAHRARDAGMKLPKEWSLLISPKRVSRPKEIAIPLQYPYIKNVRGEHAELLVVNALVPRGLPDHMRADVCQEIMLALWQKQTTIEELQSNKKAVNRFIRGFREANLEGRGYALSLDMPMRDGRSWYDVLPDSETV